jgi:glutaconate CoA-transferase subunit B
MTSKGTEYTINELMVVVVARMLRDNEMGFLGIGTGGRAFTLTFGIPAAAARLAQLSHAPNFAVQLGSLVDPKLDRMPSLSPGQSITNLRYDMRWPASARIAALDNMDVFIKGDLDVGFVTAAQIDRFGNLNITCIGDYQKPKVRLVGTLAQPELMAFPKRSIILMDQTRRSFVPKVDFRTSAGYLEGGDSRRQAGLGDNGPVAVVSNLCVLDFEEATKAMRVRSLHRGVTLAQVQENTGFDLLVAPNLSETEPPTVEEVRLIRQQVDPHKTLLAH